MIQTYFTRAYLYSLFFLLIIPLIPFSNAQAQEVIALKYLPELSLNKKIANRWTLNIKSAMLNHVYSFQENELSSDKQTQYIENSILSAYKINSNVNLSLLYLLRISEPFQSSEISEHRVSQQLSIVQNIDKYRMGHRLSSEQRIKQELTEYRQRYRISLDFPISGERLDNKEFYFVSKEEFLYTIAKPNVPNYENRLFSGLGYQIAEYVKLEFGFEHRCENWFIDNNHEFIFLNSLFLKF